MCLRNGANTLQDVAGLVAANTPVFNMQRMKHFLKGELFGEAIADKDEICRIDREAFQDGATSFIVIVIVGAGRSIAGRRRAVSKIKALAYEKKHEAYINDN